MKYENNMKSLENYEIPEWYKDAKFGIFIHWGLFSVPAKLTEWYPRCMYHTAQSLEEPDPYLVNGEYLPLTEKKRQERYQEFSVIRSSHEKRYGKMSEFGYKDFIPLFTATKYDPAKWIEVVKNSGAKYVVPVAEHHDGFALYHSKVNEWNVINMGPKRDVLGELRDEARKNGLKFGVSSHRAWNWRYYNFDKSKNYDNTDPKYESFYGKPHKFEEPPSDEFVADWLVRTNELIDTFKPDLLYFDFGWHEAPYEKHYPEILTNLYNQAEARGTQAVLNHKGCLPKGIAVYNIERGSGNDIIYPYWQGDTSVSHLGWGHIVNDYCKSPARIIYDLVDIVSKNGNLLLNIGPRADGTIPEEIIGTLNGIGNWLKVNGEAIFETRHWKICGEDSPETIAKGLVKGHYTEAINVEYTHEDIRFTCKDDCVYAIMFDWAGVKASIKSFGKKAGLLKSIKSVKLLGNNQELKWNWADEALIVEMPINRPCDHAFTLKIEQ